MRAFQQWCHNRIGWWLLGLIVWVAMLGLTSCTTILSPNPQPVAVNSSPPQATVLVNGSPMGYTPTTVNLDRKLTYTLELQKPGSAPYAQMLTKTVDPMFFLNILFLPGFLVDLATGTWKQFPDQVMAPMVPQAASRR
jgi:PEGA domain